MNEIITKDASGALQKVYTPPAGEIMLFAGDAVPDGWLPCAGALVSRSAYPELFAAVGEKYGAGDGSTTFALPDTADRFPRFAGTLDVGVTQEDAIRNITGTLKNVYTAGGAATGAIEDTNVSLTTVWATGPNTPYTLTLDFNSARVVPTADENRPKAIAFKACIKY